MVYRRKVNVLIQRDLYMNRIRPFIGNELVKVITGIRRSGKSVMLQLIRRELSNQGVDDSHFIEYNFEDLRLSHLRTAEALYEELFARIAQIGGKAYLFLDEIQEVERWETCVNSLRATCDCDIYITGSNATLLSGELATYLAGRYVEFVIYPFSFEEFSQMYLSLFPDTDPRDLFLNYLSQGGMPYLGNLRFAEEPSRQYLKDVYNSVVLKDVVKRNNVRNVELLTKILAYLFMNMGSTFSAHSIAKYFKSENRTVAPETVMNYIQYCEDAFLLCKIPRYDLPGKKILTINEKYYVADHGLRDAVFSDNRKDIGLVLENIVCLEALRRGYRVTVGRAGVREIDFICEKDGEKVYIQVAYLLASEETVQREFGAFDSVRDHFPKYVVSLDDVDMSQNGIHHKNMRDFLLMPSWH